MRCYVIVRRIEGRCWAASSPFLFITVFDVVSGTLLKAQESRCIVGVQFKDVNMSGLHNMYADNFAIVFRAVLQYIDAFRKILDVFGAASGLRWA